MSGEKGAFWIGLKKEEKEWHWVTKEPVTRLFWTTKPRTHDKSFFCGQLGSYYDVVSEPVYKRHIF